MRHLKVRLFAIVIMAASTVLTYTNWQGVSNSGSYSLKLATFAPVGVIGGLFLIFFPTKAGKPETTGDKILVLVVFAIGLLAGLLNWYLMDPGYFGGS